MKVEIALDGKNHQVELDSVGERLRCTIDGAPTEGDAVQLEPGIYSILIDGESLEVRVELDGGALRLTVADRECARRDLRIRASGDAIEVARRKRRDGSRFPQPMPGKLSASSWKAAMRWTQDKASCVVEAMKMQNEIRSPKSGKVERLLVTEGQTVECREVSRSSSNGTAKSGNSVPLREIIRRSTSTLLGGGSFPADSSTCLAI